MPALIALMTAGGGLLTLANTAANSNLQARALNSVRGRYASVYQLAFRGGLALGGLLTGLVSAKVGIAYAMAWNGLAALGLHFLFLVKYRK
jgi:predicted MFS family arabinose efflux permease